MATPRNFLITGAGRGIGRGLSRLLLLNGHRVFLLDNNTKELNHVTDMLSIYGYASAHTLVILMSSYVPWRP